MNTLHVKMANKKKVKMKKATSSKGLLLEWLRRALNNQLYPGMLQWKDKENEIFYIRWTHKSAEKWTENDLAPFRAWAAHKGKLDGKNEKQLKATFRCALNSKKELKEIGRERGLRFWKFIDPNSPEANDNTKVSKRKGEKSSENTSSRTARSPKSRTPANERILLDDLSSLSISSNKEENVPSSPCRLPAFESLPSPSFSPAPPQHPLEIPCNSTESKLSEAAIFTEEIFWFGSDTADRVTPSTSVSSICTGLQSPSNSTEYRANYSPSPEHNCYTPPQSSPSQHSFHQTSTNLWQPNCPTPTQSYQNINVLQPFVHQHQFFSSEFTELYKSANKELGNSVKTEPMEMDQFVPAADQVHSNIIPFFDQVYSSNDQFHSINKTDRLSPASPHQQPLQRAEDSYLFSDEDLETCEKIMLDFQMFSGETENRLYTYEN